MKQTLDYEEILKALVEKRSEIDDAVQAIERLMRSESNGGAATLAKVPAKASTKGSAKASARASAKTDPSEQASEPTRKKRVLSAAGRKRIVDATKKRWAEVRAAKEAAMAEGKVLPVKARKTRGRPRKAA